MMCSLVLILKDIYLQTFFSAVHVYYDQTMYSEESKCVWLISFSTFLSVHNSFSITQILLDMRKCVCLCIMMHSTVDFFSSLHLINCHYIREEIFVIKLMNLCVISKIFNSYVLIKCKDPNVCSFFFNCFFLCSFFAALKNWF